MNGEPGIPNSLGSCPEAMYSAIPAKKPVKTVLEMNLITNPSLKVQDIVAKTPTMTATRDTIMKYWLIFTIIKGLRVEPAKIERVDMGPMDNCLDVPKIA